MNEEKKIQPRAVKRAASSKVTLALKSGATYGGQIVLSDGTKLTYKEGRLTVSRQVAAKLLEESNDFGEVK